MSKVGERHTLHITRHHLPPRQYNLTAGEQLFVAVGGRTYMLAVDSVIPEEDAKITVSGILAPLRERHPRTLHLQTNDDGILCKSWK